MRILDWYYLFRLSRPPNLIIAWLCFVVAAHISSLWQWDFFSDSLFWLESFLMLSIMAAGYWINDVYDYRIDRINKPNKVWVNAHISSKKVITAYIFANLISVILTLLLPIKFWIINYFAIITLYLYARFFKRASVLGNLVVSGLTGLVVLAGALLYHLKLPLVWMMLFSFVINFIREVTKDIEDLEGDMQYRLFTLPIQIGIPATRRILIMAHWLLTLLCHLPFWFHFYLANEYLLEYIYLSLLLVQAPLLYNLWLLRHATQPSDFKLQSLCLKIIMPAGIITLLFLR